MYDRLLELPSKSLFIFGHKGVGKSTWLLKQSLSDASLKIDLEEVAQS